MLIETHVVDFYLFIIFINYINKIIYVKLLIYDKLFIFMINMNYNKPVYRFTLCSSYHNNVVLISQCDNVR